MNSENCAGLYEGQWTSNVSKDYIEILPCHVFDCSLHSHPSLLYHQNLTFPFHFICSNQQTLGQSDDLACFLCVYMSSMSIDKIVFVISGRTFSEN